MKTMDISGLNEKRNKLLVIKQQLKQEFVGLDIVIDRVMTVVEPWYCFYQFQNRPTIINLWGLTGTGKTSLVRRLVALLEMENRYFHFDMRDNSRSSTSLNDLSDCMESKAGAGIIALDEFQHFRSISNDFDEYRDTKNAFIWELLDTGIFSYNTYYRNINEVINSIKRLEYALEKGVKVEKGMVVSGKDIHDKIVLENMRSSRYSNRFDDNEPIPFVEQTNFYEVLLTLAPKSFATLYDIEEVLMTMNGPETVAYLKNMIDQFFKPMVTDCSKSLIFVIGNLDEAYHFSSYYDDAISADHFHELSKRININHIKEALKIRFRAEQIARLGNTHIIYPAFNEKHYRKIISQELERVAHKFKEQGGLALIFNKSLIDIIYEKGVMPVQGTRPVYSTIYYGIEASIPALMSKIYSSGIQQLDEVALGFNGEHISIAFLHKNELIGTDFITVEDWKSKSVEQTDLSAISALHEAGHAVAYMLSSGRVPKLLRLYNTQGELKPLMSCKPYDFLNKKRIEQEVITGLGGIVAEKMLFGADKLSSGGQNDLHHITEILLKSRMEYGMDSSMAKFGSAHHLYDKYCLPITNSQRDAAKADLDALERKCEQLLEAHSELLAAITKALLDKNELKANELHSIALAYGLSPTLESDCIGSEKGIYWTNIQGFINDKSIHVPTTTNGVFVGEKD